MLAIRAKLQRLTDFFPQRWVLKHLNEFLQPARPHHFESRQPGNLREVFLPMSCQFADRKVVRIQTPANRAAGVLVGQRRQPLFPAPR